MAVTFLVSSLTMNSRGDQLSTTTNLQNKQDLPEKNTKGTSQPRVCMCSSRFVEVRYNLSNVKVIKTNCNLQEA